MKKLLMLISAILYLQSCTQNKEIGISQITDIHESSAISGSEYDEVFALHENENVPEKSKVQDPAKEWLESLFKCTNGNKFCFYLETEEKATTKRFYEFMIDSEQIYGATNIAQDEMPLAKKKYQEKWAKIYTLRKDMEPWLFGRAQDDMENIKNVEIEKIADLTYRVFVDFDDSYRTLNEVTLVKNKNSYLIDYCKTEFMEWTVKILTFL